MPIKKVVVNYGVIFSRENFLTGIKYGLLLFLCLLVMLAAMSLWPQDPVMH